MTRRTKSAYIDRLNAQIERIERHMASEWRLYSRYSTALVRAKLLLQIQLNNHAALAAKKAKTRTREIIKYLADRSERLRQVNPVAYLRLYMPGAYSWAIPNTFDVLET